MGTGGRASAAFGQASRHHQPGRAVRENAISTSVYKFYRRLLCVAMRLHGPMRKTSRIAITLQHRFYLR